MDTAQHLTVTFRLSDHLNLNGIDVWATTKRTRDVIRDVWNSIPMNDRLILERRVKRIISHPQVEVGAGIGLGQVGASSDLRMIPVRRAKEVDHAKAVIAHELAHEYHGHANQVTCTAYDELLLEMEADDTAGRWGYVSDGALWFAMGFRRAIADGAPAIKTVAKVEAFTPQGYLDAIEMLEGIRSQKLEVSSQ